MSCHPGQIALMFLSLMFATRLVGAQDSSSPLAEINRDIWEPFVRGVSTFDDAAYLGVRSDDFVLVQRQRPNFLGHAFYVEDSVKVMRDLREAGTKLALEVRFDARVTDGTYSSEHGLVRTTVTNASGEQRVMYSRFHAISRREPAGWRVLTEYRAPAGSDAAVAFDAARPMDDFTVAAAPSG